MKRFVFILSLILIISGCILDDEEKAAKFVIYSSQLAYTSYGSPSIDVVVKNTGNAAGYNVHVLTLLKIQKIR